MLTDSSACAEGTARSICPVINRSLPDVWKAVWTLVTRPAHLAIAARRYENVAKVHVERFMPLYLQLFSWLADVVPAIALQALLLWSTGCATASVIGVPYRSAGMPEAQKRQMHLASQNA